MAATQARIAELEGRLGLNRSNSGKPPSTDGQEKPVRSTATIARISQHRAERLQGFANVVRDQVAAAPVKHMGETGFRIGGKTQWFHIASTMLHTFYQMS